MKNTSPMEFTLSTVYPERSRRVNQWFLNDGELKVQTLGRGFAWLDMGDKMRLAA